MSQLEELHLNAFLYVLKKHLCEGKNEREIPLAIYIRLENSNNVWVDDLISNSGNRSLCHYGKTYLSN